MHTNIQTHILTYYMCVHEYIHAHTKTKKNPKEGGM